MSFLRFMFGMICSTVSFFRYNCFLSVSVNVSSHLAVTSLASLFRNFFLLFSKVFTTLNQRILIPFERIAKDEFEKEKATRECLKSHPRPRFDHYRIIDEQENEEEKKMRKSKMKSTKFIKKEDFFW